MLGLPSTTEYNKRIPKQKFYDNLVGSTALKRVFVEQINSIFWTNKIAASTSNYSTGKYVIEIEVLKINLNQKSFDENALRQINKSIPYNNLFILEYEGYCKLAIYHTKFFQTEWLPIEEISIQLHGLDLDTVWENLVTQIGGFTIEQGNTLDVQIEVNEKRQKIEKEIARLEKQAWAEKQPKKKFEIAGKVKKLKQELKQISAYNNGGKTNG